MSLDLTDDKSTSFHLKAGAVRQQAITWANADPIFCRRVASLGPNELKKAVMGVPNMHYI